MYEIEGPCFTFARNADKLPYPQSPTIVLLSSRRYSTFRGRPFPVVGVTPERT